METHEILLTAFIEFSKLFKSRKIKHSGSSSNRIMNNLKLGSTKAMKFEKYKIILKFKTLIETIPSQGQHTVAKTGHHMLGKRFRLNKKFIFLNKGVLVFRSV